MKNVCAQKEKDLQKSKEAYDMDKCHRWSTRSFLLAEDCRAKYYGEFCFKTESKCATKKSLFSGFEDGYEEMRKCWVRAQEDQDKIEQDQLGQ